MKRLVINDEEFFLHWDKALWWPSQKTLLVADTHFCKDSIFREHGIALPPGSDSHDLHRLNKLVNSLKADKLVILGDFLHGAVGDKHPFVCAMMKWRQQLSQLSIEVISGNHDRHVNREQFSFLAWKKSDEVGKFTLKHEAKTANYIGDQHREDQGLDTRSRSEKEIMKDAIQTQQSHIFAGHLHPVIRLSLGKSDRTRMPILWSTQGFTILPAFGSLTGGFPIRYLAQDKIFAFGDGDIIRIQ